MSQRTKSVCFIKTCRDAARQAAFGVTLCAALFLFVQSASAGDVRLTDLIHEALENSPELKAILSGAAAARYRIPQAQSLADPMLKVGYQNDGFDRFNYGESKDAQWQVSASQLLPYPGKRSLKGEIAAKEAENAEASSQIARYTTIFRVTGLYFDLFLAYKVIDLLEDRSALYGRIEDAATARYSSGTGSQQDVLLAQTEKYLIREREETQRQRIQTAEALLNAALGRDGVQPLGKPVEPVTHPFAYSLGEMIRIAQESSHLIIAKEKLVQAAEARVKLAKKEYYPDVTLSASYAARGGVEKDMWSVDTQVNIPLYYQTKQRPALFEAEALLAKAKSESEAMKLAVSSTIQDSYSMVKTAERQMDLYKNGLIPKASQDIQTGLSGYVTGNVEELRVISSLKALIDYQTLYWEQFAAREKAINRLTTIAEIE
jgi:outer membrane protein, heavy metal efflux system